MKVLGFKKWFEDKTEKSVKSVSLSNRFLKISENIFKFPQKLLQIEINVLTESIDIKKSKNKINRYLLSADPNLLKESEIDLIKNILSEGRAKGNIFFLLAYDLTSSDPLKCYKNSIKSVETFKRSFDFITDIPVRGMGKMEEIRGNYISQIPTKMFKRRIELIECHFDPQAIETDINIPFYFNPNDSFLLEKYHICLKGILFQFILKNESFEVEINVSKPWTNLNKNAVSEETKNIGDESIICEMKYPSPEKSCMLHPHNKPLQTDNKITVKKLLQKRSQSVCDYLSLISLGMPIKYSFNEIGLKAENPSLSLVFKKSETKFS